MSSDCASVTINRSANEVFDFLADPENLSLWSFGTWDTTISADGLVEGRAMHDGRQVFVRISPNRECLLIDYFVGASAESLSPRIFARIVPGSVVDTSDDSCVLMMIALRSQGMDDQRWQSMTNIHAVEVDLIRSLIETGYDHRK